MKVGLITAPGCEESEVLIIADIIRRAAITCELVGLDGDTVTGVHHVTMKTDCVFDGDLSSYQMVILPGGYPGRDAMLADERLKKALQDYASGDGWLSAICAAPEVLDQAGLLKGKRFTCYPGVRENIKEGTYLPEAVVIDGHLITGKGPAYAYAFAYCLVDVLGGDAQAVKQRMSYFEAFQEVSA